jgi:hypothetical protein
MVETKPKRKTKRRKRSQEENQTVEVWFAKDQYIIGTKHSEFESIEQAKTYLDKHYKKKNETIGAIILKTS